MFIILAFLPVKCFKRSLKMSNTWYNSCQRATQEQYENNPQLHHSYLYPWQTHTLQWMTDMESTRETTATLFGGYNVTLTSDSPGGLIASAVGTGKTAILVTHILRTATVDSPVLLVVPAQVEQQWVLEFENMGRILERPVSVATKKLKEKKGKRKRAAGDQEDQQRDPEQDPFVVWRCSTVTNTRAPPDNWRVMLVTYNFVVRRAEALLNKRPTFDFQKWLVESKTFAQQHGIATVFHDRLWGAIVYDEIHEIMDLHKWLHSYFNTIPAQHVWGLTATPHSFKDLAGLLRINHKCTEQDGKDVTMQVIMNGWKEMWMEAVKTRTLRFSTQVMPHVTVQHRVAALELSAQEQEVLGLVRLMTYERDDLLLSTDLAAFMSQIVHAVSTGVQDQDPQNEVKYITRDQFWQFMEQDVHTQLQNNKEKLQKLEQSVKDHEAVIPALDPTGLEVRQLIMTVGIEKRRCTTTKQAIEALTRQSQYISGLKYRVQEAETNPCPICMDAIEEGQVAVTPCTHVFCVTCILPWIQSNRKCPMCRAAVTPRDMNVLVANMPDETDQVPEASHDQVPEPSHDQVSLNYSTKIRFLLTQLRVLCTETQDKAIVFCNYPATAKKIQGVLESEGISCTNLVGNIFSKNKKLKQFRCDDNCRILFLHSKIHYSGMDLFNANHIYFLNSSLNSHVVQQAVGRCVRLSQTKPVKVTFLTMTGMESVPDLQDVLGPFYEACAGN